MITSFLPKGRTCPPAVPGIHCSETSPTLAAKSNATPTLLQFQGGDHFVRSNSPKSNKATQPQFAGRATIIKALTEASHPNEVMDTDGNTWLHYGVRAGRLDLVKKWVKVPDVNFKLMDHEKVTAYTACALTKKPDMLAIAKELRDAGAPLQAFPPDKIPDYKPSTPYLHPSDIAKCVGNDEMYKFFLEEEEKALKKIDPNGLLKFFKS